MGSYSVYPLLLAVNHWDDSTQRFPVQPAESGEGRACAKAIGLLAGRIQGVRAVPDSGSAAANNLGFCSGLTRCTCLMGRALPGETPGSKATRKRCSRAEFFLEPQHASLVRLSGSRKKQVARFTPLDMRNPGGY